MSRRRSSTKDLAPHDYTFFVDADLNQFRSALTVMSAPDEHKIHVVIFRNGEWLIAQCLEHDIATQAHDVKELLHEAERILSAHILVADQGGSEPFAKIPKAPRRFWQMYKDATARLEPIRDIELPAARHPRLVLELRAA
jgi:hypothetical protein